MHQGLLDRGSRAIGQDLKVIVVNYFKAFHSSHQSGEVGAFKCTVQAVYYILGSDFAAIREQSAFMNLNVDFVIRNYIKFFGQAVYRLRFGILTIQTSVNQLVRCLCCHGRGADGVKGFQVFRHADDKVFFALVAGHRCRCCARCAGACRSCGAASCQHRHSHGSRHNEAESAFC